MNVSIIGTGYVGLCIAVGLAMKGNNIICIDVEKEKINKINSGESPIYEKGFEENLKKVIREKRFLATTDYSQILSTDISFVAVGTPSKENGSIDLSYIKGACEGIGDVLKQKQDYHLVVIKSTVMPGTTNNMIKVIEKASGKKIGKDFGICMNPEFLKEGSALEDFLKPDRIVIGEYDKKSGEVLEKLYRDFNTRIIKTDLRTAEMIKYASNAFLATKVSFINDIGNICKIFGIDVYDVVEGMKHDKRISPLFLNAGCGFGGSCLGKDLKALINKAREVGYEPKVIKGVLELNKYQKIRIIQLLEKRIGNLKDKRIAILGLAFKPGTDDIRDATSMDVINELLRKNAVLFVYDPLAIENVKKIFQKKINYCESAKDALKGADACLILTEWDEFRELEDKDFKTMKNRVIIEGRKVLDKKNVKNFEGICW